MVYLLCNRKQRLKNENIFKNEYPVSFLMALTSAELN